MPMRIYIIAANTDRPVKLSVKNNGISVNGAIETLSVDEFCRLDNQSLYEELSDIVETNQ